MYRLTRTVTMRSKTFQESLQKAEKLSVHLRRISKEKTMTVKASMKLRNSLKTTIPGWSDRGSSVASREGGGREMRREKGS